MGEVLANLIRPLVVLVVGLAVVVTPGLIATTPTVPVQVPGAGIVAVEQTVTPMDLLVVNARLSALENRRAFDSIAAAVGGAVAGLSGIFYEGRKSRRAPR